MKFSEKLICPVCGEKLSVCEKSLVCKNRHLFDLAKEGYVNLLSGRHKSGDLTGDSKAMAISRKRFLDKGYFSLLADFIAEKVLLIPEEKPVILDICCGEGYYTQKVLEKRSVEAYGFDISRQMIRLAAKRKTEASFFVANLSHIPFESESADLAFHLFAPFHESEFARILKKDGVLLSCVPGENHLFQLKQALYSKPYKNDEALVQTQKLKLCKIEKISANITLSSGEDIQSLFQMTPYFYRTKAQDKAKIESLESLDTTIEFVIGEYRKA